MALPVSTPPDQTAQLAVLGALAADLAHELNNSLGTILLAARNALAAKDSTDGACLIERCLQDIIADARRSSSATKSILQMSGEPWGETAPCSVLSLIQAAAAQCSTQCQQLEPAPEISCSPELELNSVNPSVLHEVLTCFIAEVAQNEQAEGRVLISGMPAEHAVKITIARTSLPCRGDGAQLAWVCPAQQTGVQLRPSFRARVAKRIVQAYGGTVQTLLRKDHHEIVLVMELPLCGSLSLEHGSCGPEVKKMEA